MGKWTEEQRAKFKATMKKKYSKANNTEKHMIANELARAGKEKKTRVKKDTSIVVNGWRITLGKNEVRIENE